MLRFRSPLLTEYLFLQVLRCFTSLRTLHATKAGASPSRPAGCPIRTPSDQSPLDGSPRLIAICYVLHRYCLPRHPPYAPINDTPHTNTKECTPQDLHTKNTRQHYYYRTK